MQNKTLEKWEEKTLEDILDKGSSNLSANKLNACEGDYPIYGASGLVKKVNFYQQEKEYLAIIKDGAGVGRVYHYEPKSSVLGTLQYLFPKENVNIRFAYYYLQSLDFAKYYQGAAIPHIYYKDYKNEKLVLPPLLEQQRIVGILDEAFENIEKAKQNALQNLNNAKELFENKLYYLFNTNTELWKEDVLHNICEKISAGGDKPEIFSQTKTIECNIPIYSNGIKDNGLYGYTNKPTIEKPAITISARGTIGFVCKRLEPYCPIVRLISLIPKDFIDLSFLAYAMNFVIPKNTGTSIPQLTVPNLKNGIIKYPSIAEQQKIVTQLDELQEQTKKLEQIYEQKTKNLDELKQSILQKAFNGEL
ncbi:restriction endonuclease subunit S [bacterium]|nr:restriction endonuclease subunit S [bacterium]